MKKALLFAIMFGCIGMAVWFWVTMLTGGLPWPVYLYDAGRLLALTAFILLAFQFVLSSRTRWIEKGIGLDRLTGIHKQCGLLILILVTLHPILIFLSERLQGYAAPMSLLKTVGLITLLLVWTAAGAALLYGKIPMTYESWKRIHLIGYAILPIAFLHSFFIGSTLQRAPLKGLWVILFLIYLMILANRIRRRYSVKRHPLTVKEVRQETEDICALRFEGDHPDYAPGQFMFLQLEGQGRISEPHPFTVASSPTQKDLAVCVKAVGDFTSTLAETRLSDRAYVDMPFGVFSFVNHDASRLIFIAGGIGITPFLSMLRYLRDRAIPKEVILLWANKREKDIAFRAELDDMTSKMSSLRVVHVLSREKDWDGERGHIDREMLQRHVGDVTIGEFFVCGPVPMMAAVTRALRDLGVSKRRIHSERFALR